MSMGAFDAHRLMELHLELRPKPPRKGLQFAIYANLLLMFMPVLLSASRLTGSFRPPVWLVAIEAAAPWIAVGAALAFPNRYSVCSDRDSSRFPLFGVWFFAALAPRGAFSYASLVERLSGIEMGVVAGVILFAVAAILHRRSKGNPMLLIVMLPLSLLYGQGNVTLVNCALDDSPATVYRTVVSGKSEGLHGGHSLDLGPWSGNLDPVKLNRVPVPLETYDAVSKGGPVCVAQRAGALGIAWYTAQACQ